jgi:hypothetical protein
MKHIIFTLGFTLLLTGNIFSQSGNVKQNETEPEIVVNQSMIEKFNNYQYTTEQVSFYDVFRNYNFDDVKIIINGYQKNELDLTSTEEINGYLSETKQEELDNNYPQVSDNGKMTNEKKTL